MRTIIAPVNFTANSLDAARYAADLAAAANADLHLLYVLEVPANAGEFPVGGFVYQEMEATGGKALNEVWDELVTRTAGKINIYTHMETGTVYQVLERYGRLKQPWMIVMGASAHSFERLLAGSHLTSAIRNLPWPLIVVPPNARFRRLGKVLIACDLEDAAGGLPVDLGFIKSIDELFQPSFDVLNINTPGQEKNIAEVFSSWKWKDSVKDLMPGLHFVSTDSVEEGIAEYLEQHPADLLMVFPKRHRVLDFHKSQSRRLAQHSALPVMSIHA